MNGVSRHTFVVVHQEDGSYMAYLEDKDGAGQGIEKVPSASGPNAFVAISRLCMVLKGASRDDFLSWAFRNGHYLSMTSRDAAWLDRVFAEGTTDCHVSYMRNSRKAELRKLVHEFWQG